MATFSPEKLAQRVIDLNLVDHHDLQEIWDDVGRQCSTEELVQALLRQDKLTNWQVDRLFKDYRLGFFYGQYKVLYLAGAGTFARVYRAVHSERPEQVYAVKVLRARYSEDDDVVSHFVREGEVGIKLRHPNIVPVHEVSSERLTHFFVMDFIEGNNLREFIKLRKRVEPGEATRLMIDLTTGLKYAAQHGFAHRDIKVTNVLVSSKGQAKLVDFGLAAGKHEKIPRTVDYAGLEKASRAPKDDPRSDLYFLGCVYYHMLSGKSPLAESKNRAERIARGRYLNVAPLGHIVSGLPRPVVAVVERAMNLNPEERYQTPAQLLMELKHLAERLASGEHTSKAVPVDLTFALGEQRPVMIVESDPEMQEVLRKGLKRSGYRVLLTNDPQRALQRFEDNARLADCVVFSTGDIGDGALEAFNSFGENEDTKDIPAILLLGQQHRGWQKRASLKGHRVTMSMPLKLKALREAVATLLQNSNNSPASSSP